MLARCLLECHKAGQRAGTPLQLRTFVSGRGRLENEGAKALAEAFKVILTPLHLIVPAGHSTLPVAGCAATLGFLLLPRFCLVLIFLVFL